MVEHYNSDGAAKKTLRERMNNGIDQIIDLIDSIEAEIEDNEELSKNGFIDIKAASKLLSSFFPELKDSSVCEIDHLLYPVDDTPISDIKGRYPKYPNGYLLEREFETFEWSFGWIKNSPDTRANKSQLIDNAYAQMLESCPDTFDAYFLIRNVLRLSTSRTDICRAIKLLKVTVNKHEKALQGQILCDEKYFALIVWLCNLQKIPEPKNPKIVEIASWLTRQSKLIFKRLKLKTCLNTNLKRLMIRHKKLQKTEIFNETYVRLVREIPISYWQVDHLYRYFSSATNGEQKLQRQIDFLNGNVKGLNMPTTAVAIDRCLDIFNKLENFFYVDDCEYPDSVMKLVDKYHCNDIEPFITVNHSTHTSEDSDSSNEHDFTLEKHLFYDDYLKSLYVLSKVYETCMSCKDILKTEGDLNVEVFRSTRTNTLIKKWLVDPSDSLPWWFYTTLKKCPFLFLPKCYEYVIDDLIRMERGSVDDVTWESLYFIFASTSQPQ